MHAATNIAPKADGRLVPWNKGKLIGQKPPLKLKEIWAIRIRLQLDHRARELALFNLAIDSKLRGCDLVGLGESCAFPNPADNFSSISPSLLFVGETEAKAE